MHVIFTAILLALVQSSYGFFSGFPRGAAVHNRVFGSLGDASVAAKEVRVELGDRSYPIYIDQGIISSTDLFRKHVKSKKALIVTNTKVGPLYAAQARKGLEEAGVEVFEVVLPDGEEYKTMDVLMKIIDAAMAARLDRKSTFIALGGGVIGDMCGFAASIFHRGVKFVQIPTTLMAMVDSAVGGKTAVNHPMGKNMIGAFYQPEAVIIDTNTLNSLPDRELKSGISEIIKYGLIRDKDFFYWQEQNMSGIIERDAFVLAEAVRMSCVNKAAVVAADEREGEKGVRALLNLGHTFGHAIETGLGYGCWLHGEAVATGIAMAAKYSYQSGMIEEEVLTRTLAILEKAQLPTTLANTEAMKALNHEDYSDRLSRLTTDVFLDLMSLDKKVADGQLSLVLLQGSLGNSIVTSKFDTKLLKSVVEDYTSNTV